MTENIELRSLQQGDEEALSKLFFDVFGDGKDAEYWNWKYYKNPAGNHLMVVGVDGDRIVAIFGSIPLRMTVGKKVIASSQGVDIVISPDYRKTGLFFQVEKAERDLCLKNNIYLNYAFSNKETYHLFTKFTCFEGAFPIFNMTKIIDPTPYLQQKLRLRPLASAIGFAGKQVIRTASKKRLSVPENLKCVEVTEFDHRFDDFWDEEAKNHEIAVIRDSQYLNWRYIQNPTPYKIFCVEENDAIRGFIVFKVSQEDVKRGRIVDILVKSGESKIIDLLLTAAIDYFFEQQVDVITCWMLEHWPIFQALKKKGFLKRETPHDLIVRSFMPTPQFPEDYLKEKYRWYMTMGDSDYY